MTSPPAAGRGSDADSLVRVLLWRDEPHHLPLLPRALVLAAVAAHFLWSLLSPAGHLSGADRAILAGSAAVLVAWYLAGRALLAPRVDAGAGADADAAAAADRLFRKRRAWLIVLPTAAACSAVAFALEPAMLLAQLRAPTEAAARDAFLAVVAADPWGAREVTLLMWAEFVVDLFVGSLEYAEHLPRLSWLHHCVYIWACAWMTHDRMCGAFASLLLNEVPVVLLALGSIDTRLRLDLPFGVSYFVTRVLLCGVVHVLHYRLNPERFIWRFMVGVMVLHTWWFLQWLRSYMRRLRQSAAAGGKGA